VTARFLLAAAVIVAACHLCGFLLGRLRQPAVVGEIAAGLILGPSVLGAVWPAGRDALFPPPVVSAVGTAAQLGLVVFMFLMGCELRVSGFQARPGAVATVVTGAMGLPLLAGLGVAAWWRHQLAGPADRPAVSVVFIALARSVTALPVLARILVELGLARSPLGGLALTCAATGDAVLWAALTALLAVAGLAGTGSALHSGALALAFVAVTVLLVRPALARLVRWASDRDGRAQLVLPVLVAGAIGAGAAAEAVGLHPVLGAFLLGVVMPRDEAVVERINDQLRGFTVAVLLPLFFAGVGMITSVGTLGGAGAWLAFAAVLTTAAVTKFAGAGMGARLAGLDARDSVRLGVLLNCRGITEIVVAAIGYGYGLVNQAGLTILVLTALVTTAMTVPLMRALGDPAVPGPAPLAPPPAAATSGR